MGWSLGQGWKFGGGASKVGSVGCPAWEVGECFRPGTPIRVGRQGSGLRASQVQELPEVSD